MSREDSRGEVGGKIARVAAWLRDESLAAILLHRRSTLAWLLAGARLHVRTDHEAAEARVAVLASGTARLFANAIEAPRLRDEELTGLPLEVVPTPWFDDLDEAAIRSLAAGGSDPARAASEATLERGAAGRLQALRFRFEPGELRRYRALCLDAAQAIEAAARGLRPEVREVDAAAALAAGVVARGCIPSVLLVAFDERILRYRHPLPGERRLERRAMLVLCAERGGQVAAATRFVAFAAPDAELRRRIDATAAIDAAAIRASRAGATARDLFATIVGAYAQAGYPQEWRHHHQGGAIGYAPREWIAGPASPHRLHERQPLAWNPSIAGAKSEDTILVTSSGAELLTATGDWPVRVVDGIPRPEELRL
jgi:Xaa-Pro aminopeptidase